jgi:hypothetical protein
MDFETYKNENNAEGVYALLKNKGTEFLDIIPDELLVKVQYPELNCNFSTIEIYNREEGQSDFCNTHFSEEIKILEKMPNLVRSLYLFVPPNSCIPPHKDDDDQRTFRIITGVCAKESELDKITFTNEGYQVKLGYNVSIGSDASVDEHDGVNDSNEWWTMCVLLLDKNAYRV